MQHILRRKIGLLVFVAVIGWTNGFAQLRNAVNQEDHDDKPYHFGINLGFNSSHFLFSLHPRFLQYDSIMDVESVNSVGLNLAWLVNFRLGEHFNLRLHPLDLTFAEESFLYKQKYPEPGDPETVEKKVQSILLSFPVHLEFSSDRINNFKVFTIAGFKYDYDMASNAGARKAENLIKLKSSDLSAELGIGFHIYFPVFVLTPELKYSNGLVNLHARDADLKYSNVIDKINSKMITFSLTVE